jgi:hypothetical protein
MSGIPKSDPLNVRRRFDPDWLLQRLADLHRRKGIVTRALIISDPQTPSPSVYHRTFGSLTTAYQLIGLAGPIPPGPKPRQYVLNVPVLPEIQ